MTLPVPTAELIGSREDSLVRIVDELTTRFQAGEQVDLNLYIQAHPEYAERLLNLLPALGVLAELGQAPIPGTMTTDGAPPSFVGQLGDFRILREVGKGGMGVVYEAEQVSLRRRVALKVLPFAATLDARQLRRFQNEAQAAACLHHSNIVPVFFVGCERGVHFYAMQFIDGQPLSELIRQLAQNSVGAEERTTVYRAPPGETALASPTIRAAGDATPLTGEGKHGRKYFRKVAELGVQAAEALDHAHQLGIVHRDIKPGNLLLDDRGNLWVTDFGLAQVQHGESGLTMTGDLVGTLRYMSPEQALAKRVAVDQRTDIYSLGVTVYEFLTLEPAFPGRDRQELLRQIAFDEPRPPRRLNADIPVELETIVLKAMGKNPEERYATAREMADDLQRYLENKPIRAKPPSLLQITRKWGQRHKMIVRSTLVCGLVLLIGAVTSLWVSNVLINQEKAEKEAANQRLEMHLYYQTIALAERERSAGNIGFAEQLLDSCPVHIRGWEWRYLKRLRYGSLRPFLHGGGFVRGLAVSPDGQLLASGSDDGSIKIWDAGSGTELHHFAAHDYVIEQLIFSPDGRFLASASWDGTVRIWDAATWRCGLELHAPPSGGFNSVAFSPDGQRLAAGEDGGSDVRLWDARTGQLVLTLQGHSRSILWVVFSPDGRRLASASVDRTVKLWDALSGRELWTLPPHVGIVHGVAFSPDGQTLATSGGHYFYDGDAGEVKLWDAASGALLHDLRGHTGAVFGVAFSPDGQRLASAGTEDRTLKLWDVASGKEVITLRGHRESIWRVAFSSDGQRLYSASADGTIRVWDATPLDEVPEWRPATLRGHSGRVNCVVFSPDNRYLASVGMDGRVLFWHPQSGRKVQSLPSTHQPLHSLAFSPEGRRLAAVGRIPTAQIREGATIPIRVWDGFGGKEEPPQFPAFSDSGSLAVAFSPEGRWLVSAESATEDCVAQVYEVRTGTPLRSFSCRGLNLGVTGVAFSAEGRQLAAVDVNGRLAIWDGPTDLDGRMLGVFQPHSNVLHLLVQAEIAMIAEADRIIQACPGRLFALSYSGDGRWLATAGIDGLIRLWDTKTWKESRVLRGHQGSVQSIAFSRNSKYLVSAGYDAVVRVWDMTQGEELLALGGPANTLYSVAISPDCRRIAAAGIEAIVFLWEVDRLASEPPIPARVESDPTSNLTAFRRGQSLFQQAVHPNRGNRP